MTGDVDLERDAMLVARFQSGDESGFAELYQRYSARIERLCLRRLGNRQDAEDVTQGVFVKAYRALQSFQGGRVFPWLYVVAKNACADLLKHLGRSGALRADVTDDRDLAEPLVAADEVADVRAALGRINPRHRSVLALRYADQMDYASIATASGISLTAVETLLWRARQSFKVEYMKVSA